ncbi:GNAT family N-acetyltransferase [Candidatus Falkowbacteria bacterium]|nr:GNAT family N-acetyltransferase [Candidatus Falkowbacteria bacterium]
MIPIRNTERKDLRRIHTLEQIIEGENAASRDAIEARFDLCSDGWFVVEMNRKIVGYVEVVRYEDFTINTFEDIRDFSRISDPAGENLYIIFLAVHPNRRKRGYASWLVQNVIWYAKKQKLRKIRVVAGQGLSPLYEKLGFEVIRHLPNFLPISTGTEMELQLY